MRTWMLTLAIAAMALAGCSDDGDEDPTPTELDCEAQGLVLGEQEVMTHADDGTMEHHMEPACVEPGPPATVTIEGLPSTVQAYTPVTFQWILTSPLEENHAMRTDARFDSQVNAGSDCTAQEDLQKPDDWGEEIAKAEHQNFEPGKAYDATITFEEPGTYCIRAYALVSQTNVWSDAYVLEVTAVVPTDVTHTVTINPGGPLAGSMDPADLTIALGDAVTWEGDGFETYTITSTSGPEVFMVGPGESHAFLVPGSYSYDADGSFGVSSFSGTITVA